MRDNTAGAKIDKQQISMAQKVHKLELEIKYLFEAG